MSAERSEAMKGGIHGKRGGVGGRSAPVLVSAAMRLALKQGHGRTLHPDTHFGIISLSKLKGVGVSVPRRGEGSGMGVAKRKVRVAKRRAQWVRSTLCTCRLESRTCRLESPM